MGIDINLKDNLEQNCLYFTALSGHLNLCRTLLDRKDFDVHIENNVGWTPLHYSARNCTYELVDFLLIWKLILTLIIIWQATASILQYSLYSWIFERYFKKDIYLTCIWLIIKDGQHFITLQEVVVINWSHFLWIWELIFSLRVI